MDIQTQQSIIVIVLTSYFLKFPVEYISARMDSILPAVVCIAWACILYVPRPLIVWGSKMTQLP